MLKMGITKADNPLERTLLEIRDRIQSYFKGNLVVKLCDPFDEVGGPYSAHPYYYIAETNKWLGITWSETKLFLINALHREKKIDCIITARAIVEIVKKHILQYADSLNIQIRDVVFREDF